MVTVNRTVKSPALQNVRKYSREWDYCDPRYGPYVSGSDGVLGTVHLYEETKIWERTKNYLAKRKAGTLPENYYYLSKVVRDLKPFILRQESFRACNYDFDVSYDIRKTEDTFSPDYGPVEQDGGNLDHLMHLAKLDALRKAKGNQFNAPVFILEGSKTAKMVANRATQLARALHSLKRGRFGDFRRNLHRSFFQSERRWSRSESNFNRMYGKDAQRAAASTWLEFQYGWIPFMLEVRSGVNTLMDVMEKDENLTSTVIGRAGNELSWAKTDQEVMISPSLWGTVFSNTSRSVKVQWRFKAKSADLPGKFLITNPLEVAWEVVPLSFVVDWFLPIGDFLSTLDADMRFSHVGGTIGSRVYQECGRSFERGAGYKVVSGYAGCKWTKIERSPLTSAPIPSITEFLYAGNGLSGARIASAISLLRQRFR